ncbi:MAG: radical SAM protein [Candidatus Diapherotrites archaeon]
MSLKILALNPPFFEKFSRDSRSPGVSKGGCLYYPIWLGYCTGALEQAGHKVELYDAPAEEKTISDLEADAKAFAPDLIVLETVTASYWNDIEIAKKLKQWLPETFILAVGTHVGVLPEEALKDCLAFDAVARMEFDAIARELAQKLDGGKDWKSVNGISFREKGKIIHNPEHAFLSGEELDALPFVSEVYKWHLKIEHYFYPSVLYPEVTIMTGRGCKYRCTFCEWPQTLMGRTYRARSVKNVVDELDWISKNLPQVKDVMIEDDTLTQDKQRTIELCQEILQRGLKITWTCNSRADIDLETLEWMKKAGCRLMCLGFESGVQEILNNIRKGTTIEKISQFMKDSKKAKILVHGCFMMGNKGETPETIRKTIQFAKELDPDTAQFFPIMVYPGTEAYDWAKSEGFLTTKNWNEWLLPDGTHNSIVSRPGLSDQELVQWCDEARRQFYLRPSYILRKIGQGISSPKEFPRLFKSAGTFYKFLFKKPFKAKT